MTGQLLQLCYDWVPEWQDEIFPAVSPLSAGLDEYGGNWEVRSEV